MMFGARTKPRQAARAACYDRQPERLDHLAPFVDFGTKAAWRFLKIRVVLFRPKAGGGDRRD
jgi:hypothetical protein